jgi:hypothetical protein
MSSTVINWSQWLGLAILLWFFLITTFVAIYNGRRQSKPGAALDPKNLFRSTYLENIAFRPIAAFHRIRRALEHVIEAGRQATLFLGSSGLNGLQGGGSITGLQYLEEVGDILAGGEESVVATSGNGAVAILSQDILARTTSIAQEEGQAAYQAGQVSGLTPASYAVGTLPDLFDGDASSNLAAGHFDGEVLLIVDAGERNGLDTLGGSDSLLAQAVLYPAASEVLIGEEFYASGAYLGNKRWHVASLIAQDIIRWALILLILLGILLKLADLI